MTPVWRLRSQGIEHNGFPRQGSIRRLPEKSQTRHNSVRFASIKTLGFGRRISPGVCDSNHLSSGNSTESMAQVIMVMGAPRGFAFAFVAEKHDSNSVSACVKSAVMLYVRVATFESPPLIPVMTDAETLACCGSPTSSVTNSSTCFVQCGA